MRVALCCQWYRDAKGFDRSINCLDPYKIGRRLYRIGEHEVHHLDAQSTNAFHGRNLMIYGKMEVKNYNPTLLNYDAWIFFDSDVLWGEKHILSMIESVADVYTLPYELRGHSDRYNVMKGRTHYPKTTTGSERVDGCGAGALMISRGVLEKVEPFAFCPIQVKRNGRVSILSSDYNFCRKVNDEGFNIVCNFDLPVGHLL